MNEIVEIMEGALTNLFLLRSIDVRGNPLRLTGLLFTFNQNLTYIYGDSFVLCCIKPPSVADEDCIAPNDAISGCYNLIKNRHLRVLFWIIGILAIAGNIGILVYRNIKVDRKVGAVYNIFVDNLCVADFLMGLYIGIVACVDQMYEGEYMWNEYNWRHSSGCTALGVLSVTSSELSVLFIGLISLSRYMIVKYPFKTVKISRKLAYILCFSAWVAAVTMGILPAFLFSGLFTRSGVCVALPLTGKSEAGLEYSFGIFVCFNFALFIIIAIGQIFIYHEIKRVAETVNKEDTDNLKKTFRVLIMVAVSDFFCWIPIGIMGILAHISIPMPDDIYAWMVVFVLPLNSAINPYLYTLNKACQCKRNEKVTDVSNT